MNATGRKIIAALDTGNLDEAISTVKSLSPYIQAFKIGHAITLPNGLSVIDRLYDAGAQRIFLDLKFHDIPNTVALAVREACKYKVWMMTLHTSGGNAMISAALEEAHALGEEDRPMLVGVSVLTSLNERNLREDLGIQRTVEEHMVELSRIGLAEGLDGLVCSANELQILRREFGHRPVLVTPGIRLPNQGSNDQARVGDPDQAIADGADYLVVGRALTQADDLDVALKGFGLLL